MAHPNCRQSCAGQIVVFWIQLWPAITQIPNTNYMKLHADIFCYTANKHARELTATVSDTKKYTEYAQLAIVQKTCNTYIRQQIVDLIA